MYPNCIDLLEIVGFKIAFISLWHSPNQHIKLEILLQFFSFLGARKVFSDNKTYEACKDKEQKIEDAKWHPPLGKPSCIHGLRVHCAQPSKDPWRHHTGCKAVEIILHQSKKSRRHYGKWCPCLIRSWWTALKGILSSVNACCSRETVVVSPNTQRNSS